MGDAASKEAFDAAYNVRRPERPGAAGWNFERTDDGILTVEFIQRDTTLRRDDGYSYPWTPTEGPSVQIAEPVWRQISEDPENKMVILTGHDGAFFNSHEDHYAPGSWSASAWRNVMRRVPRSLDAFLDIPTILIGAANGPATVHGEYLLLCDLVVAAESATFSDSIHYLKDIVPGDGVNIFWPLLLGWNRGRDFLLTGRTITAHEALDLGLVREVVPDEDLLPRCVELAREMLAPAGQLTRQLTAMAFRQQLKAQVNAHLPYTLSLEGYSYLEKAYNMPDNPDTFPK